MLNRQKSCRTSIIIWIKVQFYFSNYLYVHNTHNMYWSRVVYAAARQFDDRNTDWRTYSCVTLMVLKFRKPVESRPYGVCSRRVRRRMGVCRTFSLELYREGPKVYDGICSRVTVDSLGQYADRPDFLECSDRRVFKLAPNLVHYSYFEQDLDWMSWLDI